ncbi:hypothetical protein EMIHUDRAFT_427003 [Emiliania huxleyi CCMP1516]|uniref:Myo-inositol 2-dehydrogenase n=2 Tax=Emiliania huxleyi TaxID=2903 RepID=A0A0D3JSE7_EMIH1|nr:hypothetical protein EMIHUDRAFT_427003 [Emiliania huxleyi CCMP1516]EOD26432.1 hypothetical protein EMIHUDRAFT_427003 [Emiliania huxleyi CCMP1516]|eukprot:XP_005778861.1 hypothetical protein EMIHUDRAFT_427003 [Emiliania huxleyi CCMP1516]
MLCLLPLTAALHAPVRAPGTLRASAPFVSVSAALHVPVRATPIVLRAAAPSLSISTPRAVGEPIRVGIVGCGRIGIVHLETLRKCPKAKVVSIGGSSREETVSALAEKYGIAHFAKDADEVIRNPDVDAVWICSPSQYHAAQIRLAAELGKDIFCEKPIATELDETIQSVLFAREKGVKLMVALQRRFDPNFMRVKSAIMDGEIGSPVQIRLTSRDPSPPPKKYVEGGGGIFKDMAIHDLDMSRFLMGEDPLEAYDTATIIVKYREGRTATIDVCRQASLPEMTRDRARLPAATTDACRQATYGYDQRAEALGTAAMVMTDNMYPNTARVFTGDFVGMADLPYDFFMSRYIAAYEATSTPLASRARAARAPSDAPVTGEDGVIALAMAIAAGLSAKEQRWVKLSEVLPALDGSMEGSPRLRKRDRLSAFLRSLGGARTSEPEPIPA